MQQQIDKLIAPGVAVFVALAVMVGAPVFTASGTGSAFAQSNEQTFIEGSEDLPLMEALVAAEGGMIFDSPAGRIVESFAVGETARADVLAFYDSSLPALGWAKAGEGRYTREDELLRIDFFGPDGGLTVRFTLAPL